MRYAKFRYLALAALAMNVVILTGCSESSNPSSSSTTVPSYAGVAPQKCVHSECLVCKYEADLACIDVAVEKNTPTTVYNGKTYYFCSKECRDRFAKNPTKFLDKSN